MPPTSARSEVDRAPNEVSRYTVAPIGLEVDLDDHWLMADLTPPYGPPLICYDGSAGAKKAVAAAAELLNAREAVVLAVWQPIQVAGGVSWTGASAGTVNLAELNGAAEKEAVLLADEGVRAALECGLDARPL